jgi:trans-aconitate methyltransferase
MLERIPARGAAARDRFEANLIKEAIHHVTDWAAVIEASVKLLAPGGRLLVVMLPTSIEYPLFQAARDRCRELRPEPRDIAAAMSDAGLMVELSYDDFPLAFRLSGT